VKTPKKKTFFMAENILITTEDSIATVTINPVTKLNAERDND
jgi:hypothetical protein